MDARLPIIALLLTVVAGTGLLRALREGAEDAATLAAGPSASATLAAARSTGWGGETVLARAGDGHFYANVTVDGRDYRMLVDTGASVIALTGADAEAMGLTWDDADLAVVAQGASGPVEGVHALLPAISLGDHEARKVEAIIVPAGLSVSVLGQSFLQTLGQVRMNGDAMVLGTAE